MPLHPEVQAFLEAQAEAQADVPPISEQTPEMAREGYLAIAEAIGPGPDMHTVSDRTIPGPEAEIPIRVYRPSAEVGLPVLGVGRFTVPPSQDVRHQRLRPLIIGSRSRPPDRDDSPG